MGFAQAILGGALTYAGVENNPEIFNFLSGIGIGMMGSSLTTFFLPEFSRFVDYATTKLADYAARRSRRGMKPY